MSKAKDESTILTDDKRAISLDKVTKQFSATKPWNILVNGTEMGIRNDANIIEINPTETIVQAEYFLKNIWPDIKKQHNRLPRYLSKYLHIIYRDVTDEKDMMDRLDYADDSRELKHVIGLIQLFTGTLSMAKKEKKGCRIYIVEPETHCHPKVQSALMSMLNQISDDYGMTDKEGDNKKEKEA